MVFRFIAWSDSRDGYTVLSALSNIAYTVSPNFTLFSGDLCPTFDVNCINNTWKPALNGNNNNGTLNKTFVSRGNHDNGTLSTWQGLWNFIIVANNVGATNYIEQTSDATYSFDYQNSHFIAIDLPGGGVNTMTTTQINWLNSDLTAAENRMGSILKHEFISWHGPFYGVTNEHGSEVPSVALKNVINGHPLISAGFFGHEHITAYTRINNTRVSGITKGFEQFTIGRSGAPPYNVVKPVDFSDNSNAFAMVDVDNNGYKVTIYRQNGTIAFVKTFTDICTAPICNLSIT